MDIVYRLAEIRWPTTVVDKDAQKTLIIKLVVDVLLEVLENGHDLGGMGEYGRGWNDSKTQTRMIVKEMIERWKNEA